MVTVIVPTYNRADILPRIIPRYLADARVLSVIVIDDGSSDDTAGVIASLRQDDRRIQYLRHDRNAGSVVSRNHGLEQVHTPYFLMTDDDVYPDADFFAVLLGVMASRDPDIIAVRKVRLNEACDERFAKRSRRQEPPVNYDRMTFRFDTIWAGHTTTVPGTYFAKQVVAARVRYDVAYGGAAWREETDFGLTAHLRGFSILFEPKAVVFELPKTDHHGGQWDRPLPAYIASAIRNNWYFLSKFQQPLRRANLLHTTIWRLQGRFIINSLGLFVLICIKQILAPHLMMLGRKILRRA